MIRVLITNEPQAITITIDGQLVAQNTDAVETCIHQAIEQQRPVHLFLRDVSDIDEHGRALLSWAATKGVELSASGVYNSYVVGEIRREPGNVAGCGGERRTAKAADRRQFQHANEAGRP